MKYNNLRRVFMKTKSWKKLTTVVVLAMLFVSLTLAPSFASATAATSALPKLSFTVTSVNFGTDPAGKILQDLWIKKCSEMMGRELDIQIQYINVSDYAEKFKIMLAGNTLPDIITNWGLQQNELVAYGENGVFVDLSAYLDKMPNYKKLLDESPSSLSNIYSNDGKLFGVYPVTVNNLAVDGGHDIWHSVGIRKDIFDENNIPVPTTLDELTQAAEKLKAIYPDKYPIFQMEGYQNPLHAILSMNHAGNGWAADWDTGRCFDGTKFQFQPQMDGFKDAVETMALWVREGLISPDYASQSASNGKALLAAGDAFICPSMWYGYPAYWKTEYPDQKWIMVTGIKNPKYGDPWVFGTYTTDKTSIINAWAFMINSQSKNIDDLIAFADIQLSDEIMAIQQWGIEGETYTVAADGTRSYTPTFLQEILNDPEAIYTKYAFGNGSCRAGIFPQMQDAVCNIQLTPTQDSIMDGIVVNDLPNQTLKRDYFNAAELIPDSVVRTRALDADQSQEYANIMTPVLTYAREQVALFILGMRPMSDWDKFITELNTMGDIQKAMDIYNSALID